MEQAVKPGNFKRRYKRDPFDFVLLNYCSYRPVLSHLNVVYPVFSKFGSFSQTEKVSDAQ